MPSEKFKHSLRSKKETGVGEKNGIRNSRGSFGKEGGYGKIFSETKQLERATLFIVEGKNEQERE